MFLFRRIGKRSDTIIMLFDFLLIAVYFVASWYLIGSTPGDLALGIRVVNKEGQYVSLSGAERQGGAGTEDRQLHAVGLSTVVHHRRRGVVGVFPVTGCSMIGHYPERNAGDHPSRMEIAI